MLIRYFGAARAAAQQPQETLDLSGPASLEDVLRLVAERHEGPVRPVGTPPAPSMRAVLARSSFLLNETAVRDRSRELDPDDVLDVLPPFAGG